MKFSSWFWFAITGLTVVIVGGLFLKQLSDQTDTTNKQDLNEWVDKRLAESLSKKLDAFPSLIIRVLTGSGDIELTQRVQDLITTVELIFNRRSSVSNVEILLDVKYQDGTSFSATTERSWDELPSTVRKEFLQTGSQNVRIPWRLPLVDTQTA